MRDTMGHPTVTTAAQLLAMGDRSWRRELVCGELQEMTPAGDWHGEVSNSLAAEVTWFVRRRRLGRTYASETGFVLSRKPDTVLAPDFALVRAERGLKRTHGYVPGPPDLAVEVLSPSDRLSSVRRKVVRWLAFGTVSVWVVNPRRRTITVYRADGSDVFRDDDVLTDPVLPGFRARVSSLFPPAD